MGEVFRMEDRLYLFLMLCTPHVCFNGMIWHDDSAKRKKSEIDDLVYFALP